MFAFPVARNVAGLDFSFAGVKTMDETRLGACNSVAVARTAAGAQVAKQ